MNFPGMGKARHVQIAAGFVVLLIFALHDPPTDKAELVEVLLRRGGDIKGHN